MDRDDEHFEVVLGRLDSLIRHGQTTPPPPPPPSVSEATIPVLTEVYQAVSESLISDACMPAPPEAACPEITDEEKLELAVAAVLPLLTAVLEEELVMRVQPAMERALNQTLENLQPQIEAILRQRLQIQLAQEQDDQTET